MAKSTPTPDLSESSDPAVAVTDGDLSPTPDVEPVSGGKVRVPQADGEIVFTLAGESRTFRVTDHLVSPQSNVERGQLLALVDGAKLAD